MTEHSGTVERQLEKLRRDFGDVFLAALADPETVEILLNPDGTLWQERLGAAPMQIGSMSRTKAESVLRTIAACVQTTITREKPTIECELPLDGSRFAGQIPPVVPAPAFAVRKRASRVFGLDQYVQAEILTPKEKQCLVEAVRDHRNILVSGGRGSGKAKPDDALVLTPRGFRRMDSLNVGDLVTCPDGAEVSIRGVYPQGEKEVYSVKFEDGRSVESCNDHLWKVWTRKSIYIKGSGANGKKLRTVGWRTVPLSEVRGW